MSESSNQRDLLNRLSINRDDDDEERSGTGRWLIVGFVTLCAFLGVGGLYAFWPQETDRAVETASAESAATAPGAAAATPVVQGGVLTASGYVTARRLATVSAEITGRVSEVLIEEGMSVEQGQVLARLDPTLARIDLSQADAQVKAARGAVAVALSDLSEAQRVLERLQGVKRQEFVSVADKTRAEAAVEASQARLSQARGNLAVAQENYFRAKAILDKHEVKAPFAGVVTTKAAQPGEIISPAAAGGGFTRTGICTIVDMNSLEVEVEVNEAYISRVKTGQRAIAVLDAYPAWEIKAKVAAIIPTANRDKATVKVRVAIEERDPRVLPEMAAKVNFFEDETKADNEPAPATPADATDAKGSGATP